MISIRRYLGNYIRQIQIKECSSKDTETLFFFSSKDELENFQFKKLKVLLEHFGKLNIDGDFSSTITVSTLEDLSKLPISTKQNLTNKFEIYNKMFLNEAIIDSTSGSSGINFKFQFCKNRKLKSALAHQQLFSLLGLDYFSTKKLTLWGGVGKKNWKSFLTEFITNNNVIQFNSTSNNEILNIKKKLLNVNYRYISAYPSILSSFLSKVGKIERPDIMIALSGETIQSHQKDIIANELSTKIYNRYGSREFGLIGHELPHDDVEGYVVPVDRFIIEETLEGRLLITDLDNYVFPFIRYDIGDLGSVKHMSSSLGNYISIFELNGRTSDIVKTKNGIEINPQFWTLVSRKFSGIAEFQVQILDDLICFNAIVDPNTHVDKLKESIEQFVNDQYGDSLNFIFKVVTELKITKAGKRKIVVDLSGDIS
ncbi:hypothetical protein AB4152_07520 [Vibrio breoganii]